MIRRALANAEEILGSLLLISICCTATIQVASRYISKHPYSWTEEIGTALFVYLIFIGAALALKKNEHFALELLVEQLPRRLQFAIKMLSALLVILFAALVTWFGAEFTYNSRNVMTPALEVSKSFFVAAVPLGGALMLVRAFEHLAALWKNRKQPAAVPSGRDAVET